MESVAWSAATTKKLTSVIEAPGMATIESNTLNLEDVENLQATLHDQEHQAMRLKPLIDSVLHSQYA